MFDFSTFEYLGTVDRPPKGFSVLQGMCSDANGNVYVTSSANATIDVYSGDGTFQRTVEDSDGYPSACAVDSKSGTLAVQNVLSASGGPGGVVLYANGSGTSRPFSDPHFSHIRSLAYFGTTGRLFYDGESSSGSAVLGEYYKGKYVLVPITGATFAEGQLLYGDKTKSLVIADTSSHFYSPSYYFVKQNGKVTGSIKLRCSDFCDVAQPSISGNRFFAPDGATAAVEIYDFPKGGRSIATLKGDMFDAPSGSAVGFQK